MEFTVWMDGTKIGETALEISHGTGRRAGVFHPSASGMALLPGITAMPRALLEAGRMCRANGIDPEDPALDMEGTATAVLQTAEGRRIMDAAKIAVRLELHDARGTLVPWDSLLISDMHDIRALARHEPAMSAEEAEGGEGDDPIRYFITAKLRGAHARGGYRLPEPQRT
jgi:hypothetical protein